MFDIVYNIEKRNIVLSGGSFTYTTNPSVQNGGLLLLARATNIRNLIMGIGINQLRGGSVAQANYELNRWKQQVTQDGGRASVNSIIGEDGQPDFEWDVNYL